MKNACLGKYIIICSSDGFIPNDFKVILIFFLLASDTYHLQPTSIRVDAHVTTLSLISWVSVAYLSILNISSFSMLMSKGAISSII